MDVLGKFDDEGINPVDNPSIYNVEGYIEGLTPGEVQDRKICNTREYDLNLIGWCLRFNDLRLSRCLTIFLTLSIVSIFLFCE